MNEMPQAFSLPQYYILVDGKPKEVSVIEWGNWFGTADRRLALTHISPGVRVSTVFLGIAPGLWETMIFGGEQDQYQVRYDSQEEALVGHEAAVIIACQAAERGENGK